MRLITNTFFLLLLSLTAWSQYKITLHNNEPRKLTTLQMGNKGPAGKEIEVNNLYMTIGGIPTLPVMGEFHYSRYDNRFWRDALLKMKSSGVNIVSTYVLWIYHEEIEGRMNWEGNNNLKEFISLCKELDLKVHLRCGPYCNAETRNGGFPDWLVNKKSIKELRSNDPVYLSYVRKWYKEVYAQVKGFLYKDGGPVIGLQIENEYVKENKVVPHLLALKKIATEEGFDVPVYSMTHWMSVDYPKGEIVPYAGYYIETPWVNSGKNQLPVSNFQFFTYNRISDNIGTDIIKTTGNSESLVSKGDDSPYFTCEVGIGTPTFYFRRPVVPEEMAGANINLRLGCGVNLMGYYMYTGGTNRVGELSTLQSSTGRVSYDYQAPIREFGNWGVVMKETKKFNYFMNDFGSTLAPAVAFLPTSNKDTSNLQWAVRLNKNDGFLFCSNYLYRHPRRTYKNVQFKIDLSNEKLTIPRKPVTINDGTYFCWPFNQTLSDVQLNYTTSQLICKHISDKADTYFFFADSAIPSEYLITNENIKDIKVSDGKVVNEGKRYFVSQLVPGKECIIEIIKNNGKPVRFITLTEKESDFIWKGQIRGKDFVAFTNSGLIYEEEGITLMDEQAEQYISVYNSDLKNKDNIVKSGLYTDYKFTESQNNLRAEVKRLQPMEGAYQITPNGGKSVIKVFDGQTLSNPDILTLRCKANKDVTCIFNNTTIPLTDKGNYMEAIVTTNFVKGENTVCFKSAHNDFSIVAETEVILQNGTRWTWQTDGTWLSEDNKPVTVVGLPGKNGFEQIRWNGDETIAFYEINTPRLYKYMPEVRLNINFAGDRADAYIGKNLVGDFLFDGSDWIFGINRYHDLLLSNPLLIRITGFNTKDIPIYFEKGTNLDNCTTPLINKVIVKKENRFRLF